LQARTLRKDPEDLVTQIAVNRQRSIPIEVRGRAVQILGDTQARIQPLLDILGDAVLEIVDPFGSALAV